MWSCRTTTLVHEGPPLIIEVIEAATTLQAFCQAQGWRFCFIGGLAVQRWGEPRLTVDVDLTLLTGFGGEAFYVDVLLGQFASRISDARRFALENRVLLLQSQSGVGLDIALGALPFEERVVDRSSYFDYPPGVALRTCSAEDLLVMKAFAGRGQDWVDVERVIVRQTGKLDWEYVREQLVPLAELKGEPEILDQLERRRQEYER
ncbi:MAG: nucleotidyl transferase AbiEii/AbiGii toxin family protein [Gemmatimonadaceae bacterium]